jgi:hypothetical protein
MSPKRVSVIFVLLALTSGVSLARATLRTVPDPYSDIQLAIDAATANSDTVLDCPPDSGPRIMTGLSRLEADPDLGPLGSQLLEPVSVRYVVSPPPVLEGSPVLQRTVWPVVVVVLPPHLDGPPGIGQPEEPVLR